MLVFFFLKLPQSAEISNKFPNFAIPFQLHIGQVADQEA